MFLSNEHFEPIKSYYELVNKPVSQPDIEADFFLRELNSSLWLSIIRAYADNKEVQESTLIQLINRGNLIDTPFWNLQTHHFLFFYHLASLEDKTKEFPREFFLGKLTIEELFTILEQIDIEKYWLPFNPKLQDFITHFEVLGQIISKSGESDNKLIELYENLVKTINTMTNFDSRQNAQFFKGVEEIYEYCKNLLLSNINFKIYYDKVTDLVEISSCIEIEANRYVTIIRTIIASTLVQTGSAKSLGLNKIIRPLLSTLKNDTINKSYQKMASKALIKLINCDDIQLPVKEKIVKCIIGYIEIDPDWTTHFLSFRGGRKLKHFNEGFDKVSSYVGACAFFNYYAKTYGYQNTLEANDWLILRIIEQEFSLVGKPDKKILMHSSENPFFKFLLKIRIMLHIFRDINTKLKISSFEKIINMIIQLINDLYKNHRDVLLKFEVDGKTSDLTLNQSQANNIKMLTFIFGEVLAKSIIDRKKMLEFIFRLIKVDQPDEVLKEIGRDAIDIALQFAEDDDSVDLFKFLPWFIIPVLRNSSCNKQFSILMARIFKLLPLNKSGAFDSDHRSDFNPSPEYDQGYEFLKVIWNKKSSCKDEILKKLNVQESIREYQEEGISWIVSLTDFGFNWALWDDMGLGKTFQALATVAIKVKERKVQHGSKNHQISLVICPTTLVHNWLNEIKKFFKDSDLKGIVFDDSQKVCNYKDLKKNILNKYDILIISYEKIRMHCETFQKHKFMFIILDEAHLIKNSKSLTTQAIKSLKGDKKLILTGTPLQNRVTELWSIFDFLMPGFLEEEIVFNKKYTKYLSANISKISKKEKETEQFLVSIQNLRERIAPFILRRTKENVMKELPPKIIQDYNCGLTPCQAYLHEILEKLFPYTEGMKAIDIKSNDSSVNKNVIENLLAHRRLCNHPDFILDDKKIMGRILSEIDKKVFENKIEETIKGLEIYEKSGKLLSLLSLLEECGLVSITASGKVEPNPKTNKDEEILNEELLNTEGSDTHRALIFCQIKKYMYMIEKEILKRFNINYLMLDSSLNPKERFEVAEKFNNEPKYRILLLSTNIGSLGLNLTGADTVIFMEHDWNPMKDLQAIDRAHRIGQK